MIDENGQLSRKEREEAFRKDLVLDIAQALFAEKGFDGATVSEIAEKAELAKGSLYLLFDSKQEIIHAIIRRKLGIVLAGIERTIALPIEPVEKLKLLIDQKLRSIWESRNFARLFMNEFHGFNWKMDIPVLECAQPEIYKMMESMEQVVVEGQKKGQFRSDLKPGFILAAIGGFSNAVIHLWLKDGQEMEVETAIKQVQDLFLNGVLPPQEVSK